MKKLLFFLMLSCLIIAFDQANAQSAKILGKVLDVTGKGVAGVKVAVEGQKITATTSKDGSFRLEGVAPGNVYLYATAPSKKKHSIPYPVIPDTEFKAHKLAGEPRVPFIVVARKDKQGQWIAATVNIGLIFSAESFVGELKSILDVDPESLKLKKT
jgi:hypothetical protein